MRIWLAGFALVVGIAGSVVGAAAQNDPLFDPYRQNSGNEPGSVYSGASSPIDSSRSYTGTQAVESGRVGVYGNGAVGPYGNGAIGAYGDPGRGARGGVCIGVNC